MPRPRKWRRICSLPDNPMYGPLGHYNSDEQSIIMTVDEYEAIRLIDYEGLNQEECANQMNVARTTAQRIYNNARKKLAKSLVDGLTLKIEGGDYELCEERGPMGRCGRCRRHAQIVNNIVEENEK